VTRRQQLKLVRFEPPAAAPERRQGEGAAELLEALKKKGLL